MKFIVFEGLDGAGKSTLIEALKTAIEKKDPTKGGGEVVLTREPGGSVLGDEIRELLLRTKGESPVPRAELLLYEAARAQHVDVTIRPALKRGAWVLCDRYSASTVAFQAGGRRLSRTAIDWLNGYATDGCEPDLWVLLDLTTEEARRRMAGRELDRFEREAQDFHARVRTGYLSLAEENSRKWLVLDAAEKKDVLREKLFADLRGRGWL